MVVAYSGKVMVIYIARKVTLAKRDGIRKNKDNLKGELNKDTLYKIDINLTDQSMVIKKNNLDIKNIKCSTGAIGNSEVEKLLWVNFTFKVKVSTSLVLNTREGGKILY